MRGSSRSSARSGRRRTWGGGAWGGVAGTGTGGGAGGRSREGLGLGVVGVGWAVVKVFAAVEPGGAVYAAD